MSEFDTGIPTFEELGEEEGLDISAIFGNASSSGDANPFDFPAQSAAAHTQAPAEPKQSAVSTAPAQTAAEPQPAEPAAQPAQNTSSPAAVPPVQEESPVDLIGAAFEQQDAQNTQKGLFEKLPVFSYGSTKEDISDTSMTFEELRIAKSEDFPELSEGKKVSWSVEYGKSTKQITDPKGTTIASVKEEMERSKDFLTNLKKAKDKNPTCLVKPKVTAQSKGIASYKGVFSSVQEAQASDKTICLVPSRSGQIYELRKTEMGEFTVPKHNVVEFSDIRAGFTPALPPIPQELMRRIITFFRYFMNEHGEFEALVHVYWDRKNGEFVLHVPKQKVYKALIDADLQVKALDEKRYLHYADVHSHNSMPAKFSSRDDRDELATRIYIVIGNLDRYFPSITVRMSCGGIYQELDPADVLAPVSDPFPLGWVEQVEVCGYDSCAEPEWCGRIRGTSRPEELR